MKTKFTRIPRRGLLYFCLFLGSLFLYNCSEQELEFIDPYEFVNDDFDDVGELPPLVDEDPEFTEPETGTVANSAETVSIVEDVISAEGIADISEETKTQLEAVETFVTGLPNSFEEEAEALDAAGVALILDPSTELSEDLQALAATLDTEDIPAGVAALLPEIELSTDLEDILATAVAATKSPFSPVYTGGSDPVAQGVSGPCVDAAEEAYEEALAERVTARDDQLATIEGNYTRRLAAAEDRLEARLAAQATALAEVKAELAETAVAILAAAAEAEALGDADLAEQLRKLALLYTVKVRVAIAEWNALVIELLTMVYEEELEVIETIREEKIAEVNDAFAAIKAELQKILQDALNACHNQGSGN